MLPGAPNFLAKYVNGADVGSSGVFEVPVTGGLMDGAVGMGTTTPLDRLHIRYSNNTGDFTGLAVQNMSGGASAYSGMLFYDHLGALTQFQGYNNSTHEYRINNIAAGGSINFMLGGASKFNVASNGNIGIGTTAPAALLEVSNAVTGVPANMFITSYTNFLGPYYMSRRARGTAGAPTAVQTGDGLGGIYGEGYGTAFGSGFAGGMTVQAAQNWTNTAHGTALTFSTTPINATASATRMTLDASGNLGIGTTTVPAASLLEVSNASNSNTSGQVTATTYANSGQGSLFVGRKARGTAAAPAAVQNGDVLTGLWGRGYGATNFNGTGGGSILLRAAESWTDTAQGTSIAFNTTTNGTNTLATRMTIAANGNIGIGTTTPSATVEAVRDGDVAVVGATSFGDGCCAGFVARMARGTAAAPAAVQSGDALALFLGDGYGATDFSSEAGGMVIIAAENWTDTAQGTAIAFLTTPLGSTEDAAHMVIMPDGNVGIGTFDGPRRRSPTSCRYSATSGSERPAPTAASGTSPAPASLAVARPTGASRRTSRPSATCSNRSPPCSQSTTPGATADFPGAALRRGSRLRPDRAGRRAGAARARRHQRRRVQGGRLQRAAAAHHPGASKDLKSENDDALSSASPSSNGW